MKKIIFYLVVLSSLSFSSYANDAVCSYANKLVENELSILNNEEIQQSEKIKQTKKLIEANLDLDWMARYTLGGFRNSLQSGQISDFTEVYKKYVSKAYSDLVKDYKGQKPEIIGIDSVGDKRYMVSMTIGTINVKYLVHQNSGGYKVADIITEGVSLISSQQAEFTNILSGQGYDALIKELEKKS
ncbi:MAG: ABC transporter substrate-binding protein [Candidatus Rickettsia vulgarisii]